jgi:hypothetical protein
MTAEVRGWVGGVGAGEYKLLVGTIVRSTYAGDKNVGAHFIVRVTVWQNVYTRIKMCELSLRCGNDRAFTKAALVLWNSLPSHIRSQDSLKSFKSTLKTFFFAKAFPVEL